MIIKVDKLAAYVVIAFAAFQTWYAGVIPLRPEEAYFAVKAFGTSWGIDPHSGVSEYFTLLAAWFNPEILSLRIPSIFMMSFAAIFIFKAAFMLGGRYGAWAAMIAYLVTPSVNVVYSYITPAAALALFSAAAYYSWMRAFAEGGTSRFIKAALFSGICILVHTFGIFVFASVLAYMMICERERLKSGSFVAALLVYSCFVVAISVAGIAGHPAFPGFSGVAYPAGYRELLFGLVCIPAVFYVSGYIIWVRGKLGGNVAFMAVAFIIGLLVYLAVSITGWFDIKLGAALFVPAFILSGYFVTETHVKVVFGALLFVSAILTAYIKIAPDMDWYTAPEFSGGSEVYKSFAEPLARGLPRGGALFADDAGTASLMSFYVNPHPQACIPSKCTVDYGLYVTSAKQEGALKRFSEMKLYGTYKVMVGKKADTFYIYTVKK